MKAFMKNKGLNNIIRRDGAILFTVLVTMTLLIMLAATLFLTMNTERADIIETVQTEQLYQTAVSVNDWVFDYLESYSETLKTDLTIAEFKELDGLMPAMMNMNEDDIIRTDVLPISSAGSELCKYEIIIKLLKVETAGTPPNEIETKIFEVTTRITNNKNDTVEFVRILAYKDGSGTDGTDPRGGSGRNDDDGFFELPASYRGAPNISAETVIGWETLNILGRTYFGGVGSPQYVNIMGNSDFQHDVHSFDNLTIGGNSTITVPDGVDPYPLLLNAWQNLTIDGSNMNNNNAFLMRGGVVRVGGNFHSKVGLGGDTTLYCFGNVTIDRGNFDGGAKAVKSGATIYATGNVTITDVVDPDVKIYANGTVTGATKTGGWNETVVGSPNALGETEHGMLYQFTELMDAVGCYRPELTFTRSGGASLRSGDTPGVYSFPYCADDDCTSPETCFIPEHMHEDTLITLALRVSADKTKIEPVVREWTKPFVGSGTDTTAYDFEAYWGPKWRPHVNVFTVENPYVEPAVDVRPAMLSNAIDIASHTNIPNLQRPATTADLAGLGGNASNAMVITDSGYIGGNGNRAPLEFTIIIDTTNGFPDDPTKHKNIFIELRPNGTDGEFRWRSTRDVNANQGYLNILVKGAGNVIFVTQNTGADDVEDPNDVDNNVNYGWGSSIFVGHMAWVKEMYDYGLTASNPTANLSSILHSEWYQAAGEGPQVYQNRFLDSIPLHPKVDNCSYPNCYYCDPQNRIDYNYGFEFGRNVLRQDDGSNLIEKHGKNGTKLYIHNNIVFVDDMDGASSVSTFYGNRNMIFGYVYAPGSRWKDADGWSDLSDQQLHYANVIGGFIYGDLGPEPKQIRNHLRITHLMPMDYYRHPEGRMVRSVISDMVGEAFRGMGNWAFYDPGSATVVSRPGTFRTIGYK